MTGNGAPSATNVDGFPLIAPAQTGPAIELAQGEPSFAVVMAAYNAQDTVAESVESALAQTTPPGQVIVCDDGSTDETADCVARYAPDVILVRQENQGEGAARNCALGRAATSHVVVLDADDVLEPRCLEGYTAALRRRPDLDIVTCDAYLERDGVVFDRYYRRVARFAVDDQRRAALHQHFIFGTAALRRTALLAVGGWSGAARRNADTDLFVRLILEGSRAGLLYEPLARYRLRSESLSDDRAANMRAMIEIVGRALEHPSLTRAEREFALADLRVKERLTRVAELEDALRRRSPEARSRALRVASAGDLGYPARVRLKALATATAPHTAGAILRAQDRRGGVTPLRIRTRNV